MTDSSYTHIVAVVDRSGSMRPVASDMRGALDSFFEEQAKQEGTTLVDYIQFDTRPEVAFEDRNVEKVKAVLEPRGMTALLDALGLAISRLGTKLAKLPEDRRPGLVQVVVVTDGYENASREYTREAIREMVKLQEDTYNWDFVFLGANMDAVETGREFGFRGEKSLTYDTQNAFAMSSALTSYAGRSRSKGAASNAFSDDERDAQGV